jgi:hypothetical protein
MVSGCGQDGTGIEQGPLTGGGGVFQHSSTSSDPVKAGNLLTN